MSGGQRRRRWRKNEKQKQYSLGRFYDKMAILETDCEVSALDGRRRAMGLRRRGTREDWTAGEDSTTRVPALMMRLSHGCAMDS